MAGHSTSARGFGFFDISVDLSKEGFENVDEIIKIIFQVNEYGPGGCVVSYNNQKSCLSLLQYINMLKESEPKKWIFEEYCNLSEMQFRFKDKDTPLSLGNCKFSVSFRWTPSYQLTIPLQCLV